MAGVGPAVTESPVARFDRSLPTDASWTAPNGHSACLPYSRASCGNGDISEAISCNRGRQQMSEDLRSKGVQNQVTGAAKEAEGKVRDAAADITGDTSEELKAKAKTAEGKIQKNFGKAQQDTDDAV